MFAFVTAPPSPDHDASPELRVEARDPADLCWQTDVGLGIDVAVDLARPQRWRSVAIARWEEADPELLDALIGAKARRRLGKLRTELLLSGRSRGKEDKSLVLAAPDPWLRIAAIDALDRRLQLPLDQALVDAERGVARERAAETLEPGPVHERVVGEALVIARQAANGFADYLSTLADSATSIPAELYAGLERLVDGYETLRRTVVDGPEKELAKVGRTWARLLAQLPVVNRFSSEEADGDDAAQQVAASDNVALTSLVDPRQLPARVVGIGRAAAEVRMEEVRLDEGPAVLVTVPAYGPRLPAADLADRLLVRLVDRKSGKVHQPAMLTLVTGDEAGQLGADSPVFARVLPLHGSSPEDLRADVFDVDSDVVPAQADSDGALLRARRAAAVLREWRLAMAEARLGDLAARHRRLARLVDVLKPDVPDTDRPVFDGGPTLAELTELVDSPDTGNSWAATTQGPGDCLVAELAAAHAIR